LITDLPNKIYLNFVGGFFTLGVAILIITSVINYGVENPYMMLFWTILFLINFVMAGWNFAIVIAKYMRFQIMLREERHEH
jgi:FtsH-binding integral membrane protein